MQRLLLTPALRRVWLPITTVMVLLTTTAQSAYACFFECNQAFGWIEVQNGEVYFYNGCTETTSGGQRYITCYYGALN